jgi:hypothetical protein
MTDTTQDVARNSVAAGIYAAMAGRALMRYAEMRSQAVFYGAELDASQLPLAPPDTIQIYEEIVVQNVGESPESIADARAMIDFSVELQADLITKAWDFRCSDGQAADVALSVRLLREAENYLRAVETKESSIKARAARTAAAPQAHVGLSDI